MHNLNFRVPASCARWAVAISLSLASLFAQGSASLRGNITDPSGAAIPNAVVTLGNAKTNFSRKATSQAAGEYSFAQVPPGSYSVRVEAPGFTAKQIDNVLLQIDLSSSLAIALEIGQASTTISVEATASAVNTQDATVGNPFTETQIRQLPLSTRNVVELLSVQPGVTATGEVLGARRDQNNVTLDGVDVNDNQNAGISETGTAATGGTQGNNGNNPGDAGLNAALPLPLDSLQEFRVTTAGQGAAQGRSSGGQVTLVTKSGTNELHGSLYEFHRNTATAANTWFNNRAGRPTEKLIRNQFGASLGGPVIKNRIFFFGNWEDRKDRLERSQLRNVPSESFKQGIVSFRQSNGQVGTLSPAEIRSLDPLGRGVSQAVLRLLQQYPSGNDAASGVDRGLNFSALRFNAPLKRDDRAYVAKLDFNLDAQSKHTVSLRGTLADNTQDVEAALAQFPGQEAASKQLNNSRGLAARYTSVLSPSMVNTFTYGLTRLGIARSGVAGDRFTLDSISDLQNYQARAFGRIIPTQNIGNDLTWTKGRHTVQGGINFRLIQNDRTSFENSFPQYSFNRSTLRGLGQDMEVLVEGYIQQRAGNSGLTLTEKPNVTRAMGGILGLVNQFSATYNYGRDGLAVPFASPVARSFQGREYEFYVQDSFKATRELTLNYGVRYSNTTPPWESGGVQVRDIQGLDNYFADRVRASLEGKSGASMPTAALTYELAGPANGKPSWFRRDNNNFAPRFGFAYAPERDNFWGRLFGKGSVLRGGYSMVYDRYGSDMIVEFDKSGSPGLASQVAQPRNTNFSDSARLDAGLPALPVAAAAKYPFTPATILGGFNTNTGVFPNLVAPYSSLINLSYTRPFKGDMSVEIGYAGRLSRKGLLQLDVFQPLTEFKDPASGQTWAEAAGQLRLANDQGRTAANVGNVAFFENMFPRLANAFRPGTATQNFMHLAYNEYAGSFLDALNDVDRERLSDGTCYSRLGCNTFFALQNAGMRAWANAGGANFHGMTLSFRRIVKNGFGWDFNYALSHSIDNGSAAESGAGNGGAVLQDSFNPRAFRGSSDFDIRHNITANGIYELPFGKGKKMLNGANAFVNQLVGGWQVSSLFRYRSGLPTTINFGDVWPTNYISSALGIVAYGKVAPANSIGLNAVGNPSAFAVSPADAVRAFAPQYPGRTGMRSIIRLDNFFNADIAVAKSFKMPFEGHRLQFRAEAYNAFNNVNFFDLQRRADRPSTFGEFQQVSRPREMQFALRYEF